MGAKAYTLIEQYVHNMRWHDWVIEIGSERNEGSTSYFSQFCDEDLNFMTVDFNREQFAKAWKISGGRAFCGTGEDFLENYFPHLGGKIAFAYLDNFDLITQDGRVWDQRIQLYRTYGLEMNNVNSKSSHFEQAKLVDKHSAHTCLILFDDTWLTESGEFDGKGGYAAPYLLNKGYKLLNQPEIGQECLNSFVLLGKNVN